MESAFKIGDKVMFGRPNGEQTHGIVRKVNGKTILVEQAEARGRERIREAGAKWRVAASLVRHAVPRQYVVGGVLIESDSMGEPPSHPLRGLVPPLVKRSKEAIEADIDSVESQLSPENLFWDGERPRGEALAAGRILNRRLRALEAELLSTLA
ncbi:MAG TPA: hypothetical protein VFG22_10500 [Polyangiales bacterium]|nr:hypothetical protein [Polyangiales bacterium]